VDKGAEIDKFFNYCNLLPDCPWTVTVNGSSSLLPRTWAFVFCQFTSSPRDAASNAVVSSAGTRCYDIKVDDNTDKSLTACMFADICKPLFHFGRRHIFGFCDVRFSNFLSALVKYFFCSSMGVIAEYVKRMHHKVDSMPLPQRTIQQKL